MEPYRQLEKEFAQFIGTKYAVTTTSGTTALHLALAALGIGEGDEVIVPEFTMIACAFAVSYTGAKPVFVDCGDDLNMDVSLIESAITENTKAIMPVHIYGNPCKMDMILDIADTYGLYVIEDAAEAHGAYYKGHMLGSWGDIGCFSFYKNKIIHGEEGGILVTDDPEIAQRASFLKCLSFTKAHNYYHPEIGFNYRMADTQAELILKSLHEVHKTLEGRRRSNGGVYWVQDYIYGSEQLRDNAFAKFYAQKMNPRYFFKPMSMQPPYLGEYENLKAYDMSKRGLYIPF